MSDIRYDHLLDRWIIFAPERLGRPDEFAAFEGKSRKGRFLPQDSMACPFCRGNEKETPPPTLTLGAFGRRNPDLWLVRVVPNKFPAVRLAEACSHREPRRSYSSERRGDLRGQTTFVQETVRGVHEVIIECPEHSASIVHLPAEQMELILLAYQERLVACRQLGFLEYGIVFKNYGAEAGASLYHAHSQLIASSFIPPAIASQTLRQREYTEREGVCWLCRNLQEELESGERILEETSQFVAWCPFASSHPYAIRISSKAHRPQFESMNQPTLLELAQLLRRVLTAMEQCHPCTAYNLVLHTSPFQLPSEESQHWRLELAPKLTKMAGFEWGSDCYINPVLPELAAERLRQSMASIAAATDGAPFCVDS